MTDYFVSKSAELKDGERKIVACGTKSVGVLRVDGRLHAFQNVCPHQGGPVCQGLLIHQTEEIIADDKTYHGMRYKDGELHLVCPWHGWEFNIETGRCAGDGKVSLIASKVTERNGDIFVIL